MHDAHRLPNPKPAGSLRSCPSGDCPSRVFVDITTSVMLRDAPPIGVTRVEKEIARRLLARPELKAVPVVLDAHGTMFALDNETAQGILTHRATETAPQLRGRPPCREHADVPIEPPQPLPQVRRSPVLRRATAGARAVARNGVGMLPAAIREDSRAILIHGRQILRTLAYRRGHSAKTSEASEAHTDMPASPARATRMPGLQAVVYPRDGDVLWTAGLLHEYIPIRQLSERRRYRGMKIAAVFYDLIRVTFPQFNSANRSSAVFEAAAIDLLRAASHITAISEWSRAELLAFADRTGIPSPQVDAIRLGPTFVDAHAQHAAAAASVVAGLVGSGRYALAVGTVEPRKNYELLMRVWEELVSDADFTLNLVIVGAAGFGNEATVKLLERSPLLGSRIKWIAGCPDEVLLDLYRGSEVVLSPSFAEGWGLPITEALALGRPVIASDRGAQPEAAMGCATLLDPLDDPGWKDAIKRIATGKRHSIVRTAVPSWDIAVDSIARSLGALMSAPAEQ